jgi:hypothetical protein
MCAYLRMCEHVYIRLGLRLIKYVLLIHTSTYISKGHFMMCVHTRINIHKSLLKQ